MESSVLQVEVLVRDVVRRAVALLAPSAPASIDPGANLRDDLLYDSLRLVELAFVLEDAFVLEQITRDEGNAIRTVADIETHVLRKMSERGFFFEDDDPAVALQMLDEVASWTT